jgi:peptide/nickel transport system ATP-binding protein
VTPLLEVENLHVWFGGASGSEVHAVRGVNLVLNAHERVGLVGESGCGKSTTVLAILGLLPSSASVAGRVLLDGVDILAKGEASIRPHRWTDIAMVFQGAMNAFSPVRTVGSQIADAVRVRGGRPRKEARQRAVELLRLVGIPGEHADRFPHQFSGGMRQRAAIALALTCEPRVLLADEPTTALDVMVQAQIVELLERLSRDEGLAMILVSHDLAMVLQVCERINVMYAGEIAESGSGSVLSQTPAHPYTRMLFAATPDIFVSDELISIPGAPPALDAPVIGCSLQPRCDRAFERCLREAPLLSAVGAGHYAACHLNDENSPRHDAAGGAEQLTGSANDSA